METNFIFNLPTKLYFGKGEENKVGEILVEHGVNKVMIIYGSRFAKESGLLDRVIDSIHKTNIKFVLFGGARPNPTIEFVREGVELARKENVDFILMIGGGSSIDAGKLIAIGSKTTCDPFDYSLKKVAPKTRIPFGAILTIPASGSEMSNSCVIQDDQLHIKAGYSSDLNRPVFAIENPELSETLPKDQLIYGIVDMLTHTMERYFCESKSFEPSDYIGEGVMRAIIDAGKRIIEDPNDYEARSSLFILSSFSHNGITSVGKKYALTVHQLEHALSGLYPQVAHGAGLSILFPAWMEYYCTIDIDKFDRFSRNVFNINYKNKIKNAKIVPIEIRKFFKSIGAPLSFNELGISNPDIDSLVKILTNNGTRVVGHYLKPIDEKIAKEIFELAK